MKALYGVYAVLAAVIAGGAVSAADPVPDARMPDKAAQATCPRAPVAIYFGEGATVASRESEELMTRVGRTAADCKPVRVDLIAHLDPTEGDGALQLALDRLRVVSEELAAQGLPAMAIRIATEDSSRNLSGGVTGRQVDIHFRSTVSPTGPAPAAPPPVTNPAEMPMAI